MADEYGLSAEGFKQKRLTDIIQSMNSRISDQLGVQIATEPNSVFGQLVGVFAYEIADLWEQAGQVYGAMYPHTASGVSLDNASALAGTPLADSYQWQVSSRASWKALTKLLPRPMAWA